METFSALLALCVGNSPVPGEFPTQRPVTRSFDVFFDLRLSKHSWGWCFETPSRPLWRHCNDMTLWHCIEVTMPWLGPLWYDLSWALLLTWNHLPPVWWSNFRFMFLNESWYVSLTWCGEIFYWCLVFIIVFIHCRNVTFVIPLIWFRCEIAFLF